MQRTGRVGNPYTAKAKSLQAVSNFRHRLLTMTMLSEGTKFAMMKRKALFFITPRLLPEGRVGSSMRGATTPLITCVGSACAEHPNPADRT